MMRRGRPLLLLVLGLLPPLVAVPVPERDLGQGLGYVRVRELPADLPAAPGPGVRATVVDLRYVPAGRDEAAALAAWIEFRASVRAPLFALVNRDTSAEVRQVLREIPRRRGVLVVGIPAPGFEPDVAVISGAEQERKAYDAFAGGTALAALLQDNPDKIRNDEARLARGGEAAPAVEPGESPRPPAAPVDATLQRAVHLHRTLVALRRVPP